MPRAAQRGLGRQGADRPLRQDSSGSSAIQLHGGIGMTMEYKVGHYFKRVTMIDMMFGDADYHLARLADAGSLAA